MSAASALVCGRDLRPNGTVAIIDFGVAAVVGASRLSTITRPGDVVGTARYQAPERRLGVESPLTDLYAVGRVLRDLLTGEATDEPLPDGSQLRALIEVLTADRPQDRPQSARAVIERMLPLIGPVPALPGFVPDTHAVPSHVVAYAAAVPAVPAPPVASLTLADVPHLRRRAASHTTAGRLALGLALMDDLIAVAANAEDPVAMDLRWDRARWLFEAGDMTRAAGELGGLLSQMITRLGPTHPVTTATRLMHAQAQAACGRVREALDILQPLLADLSAAHGPHDPCLYPVRRELGTQLAVAGETTRAVDVLTALATDQRQHLGSHHADLAATLDTLAAI